MIDTTAVRQFFSETFDAEPAGCWAGPGRVNLIGEHTDYNDGFVLPFAIDRWAVAAVRLRDDRLVRLATDFTAGIVEAELDAIGSERASGWSAYPLGVVWALGEAGADLARLPGFDLALSSTVPVGAGLSSSAAIECAVGTALNDLWGLGFDRRTLARVGQRAENVVVGAPTGILDQSASLLGEPDSVVLLDCRSLQTEAVPLGLAEAGLQVLVVDTRVAHAHADGGYASRRAACEAGARALGVPSLRDASLADLEKARDQLDEVTFRRVRHVLTENDRVLEVVSLLRTAGPRAIGTQLYASHASMRDDFEISTPELDLAVETVHTAGAVGARMTGGGFGGCTIALVPSELLGVVSGAVVTAFANAGFAPPTIFTVQAVAGAGAVIEEALV